MTNSALKAQSDEASRALNWLRSQMQFDIDSTAGVAKLVKSYESYTLTGAWTYDQAVAVIAFSAAGDDASARMILNALRETQAADGWWEFAYNSDTGASRKSRILVGANAWVVTSIVQYELFTGDDSYRDVALACVNWLLTLRNSDPKAEGYGAFAMGPDYGKTKWDESTVYSTEHNVDVYAVMRLLAKLTQESKYQTYADEVYNYLVTKIWSCSADTAYFRVGFKDDDKYLDPQSWTVAALGAHGPNGEDFSKALDWAYDNLLVKNGVVNGVTGIHGFDVSASYELPVDKVWSEGSEGMVTAYYAIGDPADAEKAAFFHNETKRYQAKNGGVPYATNNRDQWETSNSVAGTAWFIFNELRINPFQVNAK